MARLPIKINSASLPSLIARACYNTRNWRRGMQFPPPDQILRRMKWVNTLLLILLGTGILVFFAIIFIRTFRTSSQINLTDTPEGLFPFKGCPQIQVPFGWRLTSF